MGRPFKYDNDEDRKEAMREANRQRHLRQSMAKAKAGGNVHKEKRKKFLENWPGIKITIETMDRFHISTVCICIVICYHWINDFDEYDIVGEEVNNAMKHWLYDGQTDWSRTQHIFAWDRPEKLRSSYVGKRNYVKGELHLKRITEPDTWYHTTKQLTPVVNMLIDEIKKVSENAGLVINTNPRYNGKNPQVLAYDSSTQST